MFKNEWINQKIIIFQNKTVREKQMSKWINPKANKYRNIILSHILYN